MYDMLIYRNTGVNRGFRLFLVAALERSICDSEPFRWKNARHCEFARMDFLAGHLLLQLAAFICLQHAVRAADHFAMNALMSARKCSFRIRSISRNTRCRTEIPFLKRYSII